MRLDHVDELHEEIEQWTRQRTKYEAMQHLGDAGVPCSAVLDTHDLFTDPHLASRDFIQTVDHPVVGTVKLMRWPALMSRSDVPMAPAPLLGEHTDEVLAAELGLSAEQVQALRDAGAIGERPDAEQQRSTLEAAAR